ncbi:MAG: hypothetical protein V4503_12070, partial [Gemmatimonadota bacterium]
MLVHLSCFGGLKVTAETPLGPGFLESRRVALLAILAAAGPAGVARDRLRELLWVDADDSAAERELSVALAALRRGGNGDGLIAGEGVISLNPALVTSDVTEFLSAVAAEDRETVARIYEGPFLHGVFLDAGPRFAAWLAESRERFNAHFQGVMATARAIRPEPEVVHPAEEEAEVPARSGVPRWLLAAAALLLVGVTVGLARRPQRPGNVDHLLTSGDPVAAIAEYRKRLGRDSSDALSWLGFAHALARQGEAWAADSAAHRADSLSQGLSPRNARLVHGYRLWREGHIASALALLDSLVREAPELNDARVLEADLLEQSGALIGQPRANARPLYERAITVDSTLVMGWRKLLDIAVASSNTALAKRSSEALAALGEDSAFTWQRAFWSDDTLALAAEFSRIPSQDAATLIDRARWIGLLAGRTTEALRFTAPLLDSSTALPTEAAARVLRAELYGAVADWSGMEREAAALSTSWPWGGLMLEVAAALAPGRSVDRNYLRRLRTRVGRAESDSVERSPVIPAGSRTLRLYLVGELSARLGDALGLQAAVDSLSSPRLAESGLPRRGGSYALSLQALQFAERGESARALASLHHGSRLTTQRTQR